MMILSEQPTWEQIWPVMLFDLDSMKVIAVKMPYILGHNIDDVKAE